MDTKEIQHHKWEELSMVLHEDILKIYQRDYDQPYDHQVEFIKGLLTLPREQQPPIVILRSKTGSGKTLNFQSIIYQSYKPEVHKDFKKSFQIMRKGESTTVTKIMPYVIVLGHSIYLKQHEKNFKKYCPQRLQDEGLSFANFEGTQDDKLEQTDSQVILCNIKKIQVGLFKQKFLSLEKLAYLIIDEADKVLDDDKEQILRQIIQAVVSKNKKHKNPSPQTQIIFVGASLDVEFLKKMAEEAVTEELNDSEKEVDPRYLSNGKPDIKIRIIPENSIDASIIPYSIRHYNIIPEVRGEKPIYIKNIIKTVFSVPEFQNAQAMIFFNRRAVKDKLEKVLLQEESLKFLVENNKIKQIDSKVPRAEQHIIAQDFANGKFNILLCSDMLDRGVDFRKVRLVIHYGLPLTPSKQFDPRRYDQRSGRTGRADDEGVVLTIFKQKDKKLLKQFQEHFEKTHSYLANYEEKLFLEDLIKAAALNEI